MRFSLVITFCILLLCSCKKECEEPIVDLTEQGGLEFFGFTLIDTYWDDPLDFEEKTVYIDEVHSFCNMADILVIDPNDTITSRLNDMHLMKMKGLIHLHEIFFEYVGAGGTSGSLYDLRVDYQQRWDTFVSVNDLNGISDQIQGLYIGEEPTWNGIDAEELKLACDYAKMQTPNIDILIVEAYPAIGDLVVPESVDLVGFDHYFIGDPQNDETFNNELSLLKSKRTSGDQKLVLIMDTHYIDFAHGDIGGLSVNDMKDVATSYYNLARLDNSIVGLIGYTWPGGFDTPEALGARQMPSGVLNEYVRIGKEITGKP